MAEILSLRILGPSPSQLTWKLSLRWPTPRPDCNAALFFIFFCLVYFPGMGCLSVNILLGAAKPTSSQDPCVSPKTLCLNSTARISIFINHPTVQPSLFLLTQLASVILCLSDVSLGYINFV